MLFNTLYNPLVNYANGYLENISESEDLVQDIFVKIWNKSIEIKDNRKVKSFLYTTVRNRCLNHIRNIKRQNMKFEEYVYNSESEVSIEEDIIREEFYSEIYKVINELPSQCQKIFKLYLSGLKNPEIAEELGLSIETIKTQKKRARKQLKERLGRLKYLFLLFSINF
ncbi:RNA polymerase sigma factor [Carboxylicivirga sp. RSCT41]|uniref:RNA polymerase sigma factor n=1 Tax=Carboxylicivirga agarovorans TaxID=3417570 RepID=UPI003D32AD57